MGCVQEYRERAERLKKIASEASHAPVRETLERVAARYEQMADEDDFLERRIREWRS